MSSTYDYTIPQNQQEDALPEGALTSVKKGQHVWLSHYDFSISAPVVQRYVCITGGKVRPRLARVNNETGEPRQYCSAEHFVIKAGFRDQHGRGNEFFFATKEECQRHIDRLLGREVAA